MQTIKKIGVKVWQPIIDKLDRKIESGCLRRDAYINQILSIEIDRLDEEITQSNSEAARDFIVGKLNRLNRKMVTFSLRSDLVDRLDEICASKLIVRDAFFNRILFMLIAKPTTIERVLLGMLDFDWKKKVWDEHSCDWGVFASTFYPLEPVIDPFFFIREGIRLTQKELGNTGNPFYMVQLTDRQLKDRDLFGLNCYLPDIDVPRTHDFKELLDDL